MQIELKQIQRKIGITFIFVTHDQDEALSMSDRIAVFNQGKIVQIGTPKEIYEKPKTEFVANFVGVSNLFKGEISVRVLKRNGTFVIRPEKLFLSSINEQVPENSFSVRAKIQNKIYTGANSKLILETEFGNKLIVSNLNANLNQEIEVGKEFIVHGMYEDIHTIEE